MLKKLFKKEPSQKRNISLLDYETYFFGEAKSSSPGNYRNNVIVYRCVNLIASTASHVPFKIYEKKNSKLIPTTNHRILQLLKEPNNIQGGVDFLVELISNKLLFGNSYILSNIDDNNNLRELYNLQNNNIEVITGNGKILGYRHTISGKEHIYSINQLNSFCKIMHLKNYNPNDKLYGLSPLLAASNSIEIHNLASNWNISLLKNGARPSGALIMKDTNSFLTDEQFNRLQDQFRQKYSGSDKVGKPLLLEGGLDWRDMSISPKDMDFIESKNMAAREIALAFGVPPQLLGIAGDNTYNNMKEARMALWEETIIPLLDKISDSFSSYFSRLYGENILIDFDRDEISALTGKRDDIWARIESSDFMSINEKRAHIGLPPIMGGDKIGE